MSKAFERAAAVGIKVLGVGNVTDCYGVRVDAESFDRAVARLEAIQDALKDYQNDEQSDLSYDHMNSRRRAAISRIQNEMRLPDPDKAKPDAELTPAVRNTPDRTSDDR